MSTAPHDSTLAARARRYIADAGRAFERAPVEVTLSVILAIAFSWSVEKGDNAMRDWAEFATAVLIAMAVAFTATLLHGLRALSARGRWALTVAGVLTAVACGMFGLDFRLGGDAWRAAALLAASGLLVLGAPALAGRDGALDRYRLVSGRFVIRTLAVLLYAGALFAGLALALAAIDNLFELHLDETIYAHVFGWIFIVLVTWTVVGGVDDYVRPAEEVNTVGRAVHRLASFLVTPLVIIYFVILYAYMVRIGITREIPKNLVSPLVTVAGLLAAIALTLFDRSDQRPGFSPLRVIVPLFVPLCVLGIWAILLRLEQYGWTEFRGLRLALLVALGALAILATFAVFRRRRIEVQAFPLILALVLALAVVGPWSVQEISRRSQQERLAAAMAEAGIDPDATTVQDSVLPDSVYTTIRETTRYLYTNHGPSSLPPLFAQYASEDGRRIDLISSAGLRSESPEAMYIAIMGQLENGAMLDDRADGALYYVRLTASELLQAPDTAGTDSSIVRIPIAGVTYTIDAGPMIDALRKSPERGITPIDPQIARVPLRDTDGNVRGELYVTQFQKHGPAPATYIEGIARLNQH